MEIFSDPIIFLSFLYVTVKNIHRKYFFTSIFGSIMGGILGLMVVAFIGSTVGISYSPIAWLLFILGINIGGNKVCNIWVMESLTNDLRDEKRREDDLYRSQRASPSFSQSDWEDVKDYRNSEFDYRRPPNSGAEQPQQQPRYNSNHKKLPHMKRRPEDAKYWAIYEDSAASEAEKQFAWRRITGRGG